MEGKKYLLIASLLFIIKLIFGQHYEKIYQAYVYGDMAEWKIIMDSFEPNSNSEKLELINYFYGYIAYCIDQDADDLAKEYLVKAENLLTELEREKYNLSMINAYKSAFVGFEIGIAPYKAPFIGQQSLNFAEKSIELDSTNFFGYLQLANIAFYTPTMFGGSKNDAMKYYLKALVLFNTNSSLLKNNWNYLNLLATVIIALTEQKKYVLAKKYCIKTLSVEPNFKWIKNQLYPEIQKQLNDE